MEQKNPDLDREHFALVLEIVDTAALRRFRYGVPAPNGGYLAVDPRPLDWGRQWPGADGDGLSSGPISEMRRQALTDLSIREATDEDLECVAYTGGPLIDQETARRQWACLQEGTMWTYLSTARRDPEETTAPPRWVTRVSGTIGGWQYVVVDVVTQRNEGTWSVVDVRMVDNIMSMPPPPPSSSSPSFRQDR